MIRLTKDKKLLVLLWIVIFGFMFIHYTSIKPVMPDGVDDWTYISYSRPAIPIWKSWNPTKILPETIMGIIGHFAAYVLTPLTGNYLWSLTFSYAFIISITIATSIIGLTLLLQKTFKKNKISYAIFASLCYFFLNFIILRGEKTENLYLYGASNLNCLFNYTIPLLIGLCVGFKVIYEEDLAFIRKNPIIYVFILYLVIFSNMVTNIIIISPLLYLYIKEFLKYKTKIFKKELFKKMWPFYYVFLLEIVCLVFEFNGGRAKDIPFNLGENLAFIITDIKNILKSINLVYFSMSIAAIALALFLSLIKRKGESDEYVSKLKIISFSFVISLAYIMLLYIRIGEHKLYRSENLAVIFTYYLVLVALSLCYIIQNSQIIRYSSLIIIYFLLVQTLSGGATSYKGTMYHNSVYETYRYNQNIIDRCIEVDRSNGSKVIISDNGHPILSSLPFSGERLSTTLYRHGITSKKLNIIFTKN